MKVLVQNEGIAFKCSFQNIFSLTLGKKVHSWWLNRRDKKERQRLTKVIVVLSKVICPSSDQLLRTASSSRISRNWILKYCKCDDIYNYKIKVIFKITYRIALFSSLWNLLITTRYFLYSFKSKLPKIVSGQP